tara:strand:+ start:1053 stop:1466 length:414 start_codon:yes stop_codon:yes gene_type:complete
MATKTISIGAFTESLNRHFPGCIPLTGESISGQVASISLWEFHLHGSLTTKKVSHSDTIGEITLGFWQKEEERARRPLKRKTVTTKNPEEMEEFVKWCAEWVTGVLHVLTVAFEPLPDAPEDQKIADGLDGLLNGRR